MFFKNLFSSEEMVNMNMNRNSSTGVAPKRGMVLPFTPLAMSFDDVNYYVDMPPVSLISFFTLLSLIFFPNCRNIIFLLSNKDTREYYN